MDKTNKYALVFQAYGKTEILAELSYALSSLFQLYNNNIPFHIHIYTDQPHFFKQFDFFEQLQFSHLDSAKLKEWAGEYNFVHRVKIKLLVDFCQNWDNPLLYCDSDISFLQKIDSLFQKIEKGELICHENEGNIGSAKNPIFKKTNTFLNKNPQYGIPLNTFMYNAGVLGFRGDLGRELLPQVLELSDQIYPHFPKHIVEQLSFSHLMQKSGKTIYTSEKEIFHYWFFKDFRKIILSSIEKGEDIQELKVQEYWKKEELKKKKKWWKFWD